MKTTINLETLVNWSPPKRVETKHGPKNVRNGEANQAFWSAWKSDKETLKAAGISCGKNKYGSWEAVWWLPLDAEDAASMREKDAASRATNTDADFPRPEGLEYLPFQRAGIAYALERDSVLIADSMGLGKTVQAIGVWNADTSLKKTLIICPATLRLNWKREFSKWAVRPVKIEIVDGGKPSNFPKKDFDVLIVNFDVVHKHRNAIDAIEWDFLVVDEAHNLRNQKAIRTKAVFGHKTAKGEVKSLPINARRRAFLTGTPIVNRPIELWPLVESIDPNGLGKKFFTFAMRYANATQTRWGWDFSGASRLDELQRLMRERFMVRRLKEEVLADLPAKRRQVIEIPANGAANAIKEEKRIFDKHEAYLAELDARIAEMESSEDYDTEELDGLRKEKSSAWAVAFSEMSKVRHEVALAKVPYVIEHLEEALEEGPIVCFAHHKDVVAKIAEHFAGKCVTLTGDTSMEDRQANVDAFQAGTVELFIGNIQAAGVGITLTRSSRVVFAELDWVPGNLSQAEDRCHRIGQLESVLIQHIVLEDSVDAVMVQKVIAKQEVIHSALDAKREMPVAENVPSTVEVTPTIIKEVEIEIKEEKKDAAITPEQKQAIHTCLKHLAGVCDGARKLDGAGFNRFDTGFGTALAYAYELTDRQAAAGKKLVIKYQGQLPAELIAIVKG